MRRNDGFIGPPCTCVRCVAARRREAEIPPAEQLVNIIRAVLIIAGIFLAVFLVGSAIGCKSSTVKGGTARHDTGGFKVEYALPGGGAVTITDKREVVATTQPSVTLSGDKTKFDQQTAPEGQLGAISFDVENVKRSPTAWGLIGILVIVGLGFYLARNWPGVILCSIGVVLAFVYPMALVWICVIAAAWLIWTQRGHVALLIEGVQKAKIKLPDKEASVLRTEMEKAASPSLKAVVANVKAGLPAIEQDAN